MDINFILTSLLTLLTIFMLESVLSIDNAAVLAARVVTLPEKDRSKALTYGIVGAYVFRGLSLLGVGWLLANPQVGDYVKIFGGIYLIWLCYSHFTPKKDSIEEGGFSLKNVFSFLGINISPFWLIVIEVEILDLVFSIDNLLACVAMSDNMWLIVIAVFLAIASMRFVTKKMSMLMEKHPYLENRAYWVICLIGVKLVVSALAHLMDLHYLVSIFENHYSDLIFSLLTMALFLPIGVNKKEYINKNTIINN